MPLVGTEEYIGGGVYTIFDGDGVWLYANDLKHPTDKIYLEPEVFMSLLNFMRRFYPTLGK